MSANTHAVNAVTSCRFAETRMSVWEDEAALRSARHDRLHTFCSTSSSVRKSFMAMLSDRFSIFTATVLECHSACTEQSMTRVNHEVYAP